MEKLKGWATGHLVTLIKGSTHGTEYIIAGLIFPVLLKHKMAISFEF